MSFPLENWRTLGPEPRPDWMPPQWWVDQWNATHPGDYRTALDPLLMTGWALIRPKPGDTSFLRVTGC